MWAEEAPEWGAWVEQWEKKGLTQLARGWPISLGEWLQL